MFLLDYNDDLSLHVTPNDEHGGRLSKEKLFQMSSVVSVLAQANRAKSRVRVTPVFHMIRFCGIFEHNLLDI